MSESRAEAARSGRGGEVAVLLWAGVVGTSFYALAPALVGAFMDQLGLSVREVGLVSSAQLAGSALGNVLALLYGRRLSVRTGLIVAVAITGVFDFATAFIQGVTVMLVCRFSSGIAAGVAFAVVNAAAARLPRPGVMFSAISIVQMLFGIVGFIGMPALLGAFGLAGVFVALGACSLICVIAAGFFASNERIHAGRVCASLSLTPQGALLLLSLFATYLASTAVWTYLDRIGVAAGLANGQISVGLAVSMVAGILGAIVAALLLLRSEETDPFLVAGAALMMVSTVLLVKASVPAAYWTALFGFNSALALVTPLYLARLSAEKCGDGRILVAMLLMYLGFIGGPMLGAGLVVGFGFQDFIEVAAALFLAAATLAFGATRMTPQMVTQ